MRDLNHLSTEQVEKKKPLELRGLIERYSNECKQHNHIQKTV